MRNYQRENSPPQTVLESLTESYNNADLSGMVRNFVGPKPSNRKEELLATLMRLIDDDHLPVTWQKLTPREQAMAAQTAWSESGIFNNEKFRAAYSGNPDPAPETKSEAPVSIMFGLPKRTANLSYLQLLMPRNVMAREMQRRLRTFVPRPAKPTISTIEAIEQTHDFPIQVWDEATRSYRKEVEAITVQKREMQQSAINDLLAVLRLVDSGNINVSDKNRWPTPAAIRRISEVLDAGDFYPDEKTDKKKKPDDDDHSETAGPIRAFAWPLLLQTGKLVKPNASSRLELTKAGRAALLAPPQETIRDLWDHWMTSDLLDEFRRIDAIRGQTGNGKRGMTNPADRRVAVVTALKDCPVDKWVAVDTFSRYMQAAGYEFEVTKDSFSLYLSEHQYGNLGYEGYGGWNILQFRYLLCLLMEYAATLGLIDIAIVPPAGARSDYAELWGTDDLYYLSRYDGLFYLRLTPLGAYVLGLQGFTPTVAEARQLVALSADLTITAKAGLSTGDLMLLDTFTAKSSAGVWKLHATRLLEAVSAGRSVDELTSFLKTAGPAGFPEPVTDFFTEVNARASSITDVGPARLIRCAVPTLATYILNDPAARKLCSPVGDDQLVVLAKNESAFHRAVRKLGFIVRTSKD